MCRLLLPNPNLLIYSSLQREALASSTIEGTIASPEELVLFQVSQYSKRAAVREVDNYREALEWGSHQVAIKSLTANLMHGLHQRLLNEVRGQQSVGRFKEYQNFIGSRPDDMTSEAIFVPPPPERVNELISDLERYINREAHEPKIVQCALAHYQFETIHPFSDGNGRVGRLLIILQLIQQGLLSAPLIYPSVYFERTRQEYYRRLQDVREHSAWNEWVLYFSEAIAHQCRETIALTQTILTLRQQLRDQVANVRRRAACGVVIDAFFESPTLSIRQISDRAHLTPNSVQATLAVLEELGLVYEYTGRQKGRIYACRPVLKAIFEDRPPRAATAE